MGILYTVPWYVCLCLPGCERGWCLHACVEEKSYLPAAVLTLLHDTTFLLTGMVLLMHCLLISSSVEGCQG